MYKMHLASHICGPLGALGARITYSALGVATGMLAVRPSNILFTSGHGLGSGGEA